MRLGALRNFEAYALGKKETRFALARLAVDDHQKIALNDCSGFEFVLPRLKPQAVADRNFRNNTVLQILPEPIQTHFADSDKCKERSSFGKREFLSHPSLRCSFSADFTRLAFNRKNESCKGAFAGHLCNNPLAHSASQKTSLLSRTQASFSTRQT